MDACTSLSLHGINGSVHFLIVVIHEKALIIDCILWAETAKRISFVVVILKDVATPLIDAHEQILDALRILESGTQPVRACAWMIPTVIVCMQKEENRCDRRLHVSRGAATTLACNVLPAVMCIEKMST